MDAGCKRAVLVWHRRAGKDKTSFNFMVSRAASVRGVYYYILPTYAQGRKVVWDGIVLDERGKGMALLDHIPRELVVHRVEDEMQVTLLGGSIIQVIGSDKLDSIRGTNPVGVVFSEYAIAREEAWSKIVEPVLLENKGWAIFAYTPNGQNHGFKLYEYAKAHPGEWFTSLLTINDTKRPDGRPLVDPAYVEEQVASGRLDRETADQEYYCSFLGSIAGAYYARQMAWLLKNDRIKPVAYEPKLPVATWWDLGYDDATTIWFVQRSFSEVRLIDYEEHSGEGIPFYARLLKDKPYVYSHHVMPHDVAVHDLSTGVERRQTFINLGVKPLITAAKLAIHDGIDAARALLMKCWIDSDKCEQGIQALREYRKDFDAEKGVYKKQPRHDASSHGADAFRTGAVGDNRREPGLAPPPRFADSDFDPLDYQNDPDRRQPPDWNPLD